MTIKSSASPNPPLSFSEIEAEFGAQSPRSLGTYRYSQTVNGLTFNGIDDGVPTSGQIKFSDFFGKSLNIVVDCFSGGGDEFRINAKNNKWNNNSIVIINPSTVSKKETGTKITIRINKKFGSDKSQDTNCALRTGSWNNPAALIVDLGSSARVLGAGGNGGKGADGISNNGQQGGDGSSGLGIEHQGTVINLRSGAIIRAGFAGGGGGGGGRETSKNDRRAGGGGGGGGAGFPVGLAGAGGDPPSGTDNDGGSIGSPGSNATETTRGTGGNGGDNEDQAFGGKGGDGGQNGTNAQNGADSSTEGHTKPPGSRGLAGSNGASIRKSSGVSFTFGVNSGSTVGSTNATGVS
tara:strand:+ start:914 stop:1963 length:1050 start_codon:yes stop_codon:yes gene_type:complete